MKEKEIRTFIDGLMVGFQLLAVDTISSKEDYLQSRQHLEIILLLLVPNQAEEAMEKVNIFAISFVFFHLIMIFSECVNRISCWQWILWASC